MDTKSPPQTATSTSLCHLANSLCKSCKDQRVYHCNFHFSLEDKDYSPSSMCKYFESGVHGCLVISVSLIFNSRILQNGISINFSIKKYLTLRMFIFSILTNSYITRMPIYGWEPTMATYHVITQHCVSRMF